MPRISFDVFSHAVETAANELNWDIKKFDQYTMGEEEGNADCFCELTYSRTGSSSENTITVERFGDTGDIDVVIPVPVNAKVITDAESILNTMYRNFEIQQNAVTLDVRDGFIVVR